MSIITLMNQIKTRDIVLPAIQRDFVWPEEKIQILLDSIMRTYPIGIALLWETYEDIQYRNFDADFKSDNRQVFKDNSRRKKLKVVLDGQQRLQSLYIALYGQYDVRYLYFDVLSGHKSDDFREERFNFSFLSPSDADARNKESIKLAANNNEDNGLEYFVKAQDLFVKTAADKRKLRKELTNKFHLNDEDEGRIENNLALFDEVLTKDETILKTSVIDENLPPVNPSRKSPSDVLEIFVRVNRLGTPLSRSDLIFSMLKLNWKESAEALPDFVRSVNEGNSFNLDTDFVIRSLFAVSDIGTKFDIDLLRKKSNVDKMQQNFAPCCDAIRSTVDFVQNECWIASSKLIGSYNTLIPIVYYLFHIKNHQVPNDQIESVRKALYLFGLTKPFSRYAESRLNRFIKDELKPRRKDEDALFPLKSTIGWVAFWSRIDGFDASLLQQNPNLALHVIQQITGAKTHYQANSPEIDHIFPRSVLREKGFEEAEINDLANFWILAKGKNMNKSNRHPKKYFADVGDAHLKKALINRDLLNYNQYRRFIKERRGEIISHVKQKLGFSDADFGFLYEDEEY